MRGLFFPLLPQVFNRIEIGGVRRQWLNRQASGMRLAKVLHGLAGMSARAIVHHHDVPSRLGQHVAQKGRLALGVQPPLMPCGAKPSRARGDEAKHLGAFALATGGHCGGARLWGLRCRCASPMGQSWLPRQRAAGLCAGARDGKSSATWSDAMPGVWLHGGERRENAPSERNTPDCGARWPENADETRRRSGSGRGLASAACSNRLRDNPPLGGPLCSRRPALGVALGFMGAVALVDVCPPASRRPGGERRCESRAWFAGPG